ncbi:MAG: hypothetical protein Q9O62_05145 [Ardenticatenia bacterium]|nr:hypothetical protein [Ardenticatenia bacterium]
MAPSWTTCPGPCWWLPPPLLAQGYLIALPPLVAGLLGGPTLGLWVGITAALWAKIFGGMGGLPVDLLALNEYAFSAQRLAERFAEADSLETLRLLIAPFAAGSVILLLHLLQIIVWGAVGYTVGRVRSAAWTERAPWAGVGAAVAAGTALAWAGLYAVPAWLPTRYAPGSSSHAGHADGPRAGSSLHLGLVQALPRRPPAGVLPRAGRARAAGVACERPTPPCDTA